MFVERCEAQRNRVSLEERKEGRREVEVNEAHVPQSNLPDRSMRSKEFVEILPCGVEVHVLDEQD